MEKSFTKANSWAYFNCLQSRALLTAKSIQE